MTEPSQLPLDVAEILSDPRLSTLKPRPANLSKAGMVLKPSDPPSPGESRFLLLREEEVPFEAKVEWVNDPGTFGLLGLGQGFGALRERARFEEARAKPATYADAWSYADWLIVSPAFADIVRRFDPLAVETAEVDWSFTSGGKLDGYQFLDVRRSLPGYDYRRSVVNVEVDSAGTRRVRSLGYPRAIRRDLPDDVHVFRDRYFRYDVFFSRELAKALSDAGMQQIYFEDPVKPYAVEL
jgi:hypothetical protein